MPISELSDEALVNHHAQLLERQEHLPTVDASNSAIEETEAWIKQAEAELSKRGLL